jgi:hypothetical protein
VLLRAKPAFYQLSDFKVSTVIIAIENNIESSVKIPVDADLLDQMEAQFAPPDHEVFQLTPPEFHHWANVYYDEMNRPLVTHDSFWDVYRGLLDHFRQGPDAEADLGIPLSSHMETSRRIQEEEIPLLADQQPLRRVAAVIPNGPESNSSLKIAGPSSSRTVEQFGAREYAHFTSSEESDDGDTS